MFVVNTFSQLAEAVREGASEIIIYGKQAVSLRRQLERDDERSNIYVEGVEYEAVNDFDRQPLQLLLCRRQ